MDFDHNDVYVGKDIGGRQCAITDELISIYEAGTDDHHPWYRGRSPMGDGIAPALLLHSEVYRSLSWYLPNLVGNLHARQEWELFYPMRVGETVVTRSTVVERYRKRNRDYVVNEVLITDTHGRWLQRSRTHQSFLTEQPDVQTGVVVDKSREKRPERRFDVDSGTGEETAPLTRAISLAMCEAFSGPERNYHNDREMARMLGFPDIVVQGMMSICFVSEVLTRTFGAGWFCGGKLNVSLVNPVWAEETLTTRGRVREEQQEGGKTRVHLDVWAEKPDGTKTLVGSASAVRG